MPMPKTAVYKYHRSPRGKDQIGAARQLANMQAVPKALLVQIAPDYDFRLGIFTPNAGHHPAANIRGDDVSH